MLAFSVWSFINPNKYDVLIVIIDSHYFRIRFCVYSALAYWYDHLGAWDCTSYRLAFPKKISNLDTYIREGLVFVIPIGMIQAITNQQVGLK